MSFDNHDYPNRKDNRRKYVKGSAKSYCRECRNNGMCDYCRSNRQYRNKKRELAAKDRENDNA